MKALPFTDRHESCPVCAWVRWLQIVAAFDTGGRTAIIRLLSRAAKFDSHLCHSTLPTADTRSALFRSIRKNGNLSQTALSGAAVHAAIRRRHERNPKCATSTPSANIATRNLTPEHASATSK